MERIKELDLQMQNFILNVLKKKKSLKEIKYSRIRQTLKIIDAAISNPIISFWFLSIFGHFQITQENQNHLIQSRKISCNWGKIFFLDYLKRKDS